MLEISSRVVSAIGDEASRYSWRETCGLLFGSSDRIVSHLPCRNAAPDPRAAFEIDPAQLIAALRAERNGGAPIAGCYHSHPDGAPTPSIRDAEAAAPNGWIWLIVAGRGTGCYRAVAEGRYHGRFDAVAHRLVKP